MASVTLPNIKLENGAQGLKDEEESQIQPDSNKRLRKCDDEVIQHIGNVSSVVEKHKQEPRIESASTYSRDPLTDSEPRVAFSGGAIGADLLWTKAALESGWIVEVKSFEGHRIELPRSDLTRLKVFKLSAESLRLADEALRSCNTILKRSLNGSIYVRSLLQRNFHIVKDAEALLAVGKLNHGRAGRGLNVEGGTAWGCQLYFNLRTRGHQPVYMWFYDTTKCRWFKCHSNSATWTVFVGVPDIQAFRRVALIGSREIDGEVFDLMQKVFNPGHASSYSTSCDL